MKFWRDFASYPFKSHDIWFVTEDIRWGKFEPTTDIKALVDKVNREDLWRDAAKTLGVAAAEIPASTSRGKETFFDGKVFDPENPLGLPQEPVDQARRGLMPSRQTSRIRSRPAPESGTPNFRSRSTVPLADERLTASAIARHD